LLSQPYSEVKEQKTSKTKRSKSGSSKKGSEENETETEDSGNLLFYNDFTFVQIPYSCNFSLIL